MHLSKIELVVWDGESSAITKKGLFQAKTGYCACCTDMGRSSKGQIVKASNGGGKNRRSRID